MSKEQTVIKYYVLCNKLKDLIRTGWVNWNVQRNRIESVAEHIYSTQMLAIAMKYTYNYDIDLLKVILMLAIHESEEIFIGDLTIFDISKEEKEKMGHEAIHKLFNGIIEAKDLENLILEFDEKKTKESIFAFYCDKLECDLQAKLYDEQNCVDVKNQDNNDIRFNEDVDKLLKQNKTWGEMWMIFGQQRYNYDENFKNVSNYALSNKISR
jgi:putative hydrolase of HD superfamily